MTFDTLFAADGPLVRTLVPIIVCVVAAFVLAWLLRVLGGRLLDDKAEVNSLAKATLVGVSAVGFLLGLGRLVDPVATDTGLQAAMSGMIGALPGLTISFILVIVALLVAAVLRATVTRVIATVRPAMARVAGAVVYWAIVVLVSLIAAEQAGMDVGVLRQLLLITFSGLVVAAALGLGLGLRPLLGSVIAGRHVDNMLEVGSIVTFGDVTGEVVGVGHVSVSLRTPDGQVVDIPHERFLDQPTASSG